MSQLSYIKRANRLGTAAGSTATALAADDEKAKNVNGVVGGIGYAAEKIGLGFLSSLEGLVDYTAGGIAKLLKNSDFAEEVFKNDWVNYNHADEWYNPSDGWKFVGDVTGGIGTSLPAIVASAGIVAASGGAAAPALVSGVSSLVAGLGAAGNATKEAYYESGKLDGKAFGYGALSGATEAGLEYVSGALGAGSSAIARRFSEGTAKNLAKSTAAGVGKSVAKKASHSFAKQAIGDFMSEAFEEGMSEILAPVYKRMTYDPNAESATAGEVGYAALVGGLSGVLMGAGANALGSAANIASGAASVKNGSADSVIRISREISSDPDYSDTGYGLHEQIREHYAELEKALEKTDGQVATLRQKLLVGALKRENAAAVMLPFIERSAENVVRSPELYAERFKSYEARDMKGAPLRFTAEELLRGIDMSDTSTQAGRRRYLKSLRKSLTSDTALSRVAIAEATGTLVMDTRKMASSALSGERLASGADFTYLAENGSREEIEALSRLFGTDDFGKLTRSELNAKIGALCESGALTEKAAQIRRMLLAESGDNAARPAPSRFSASMENGVYRVDELFIIKESGLFYLYDRADRSISRALSAEKLNAALSEYRTRRAEGGAVNTAAEAPSTAEQVKAAESTESGTEATPHGIYERLKAQNAEAARVAATVDGYSKLSAPNKREVRALIRSAQAHGLAEGDVRALATVSARAGVKITLDESACLRRRGGKAFYVDGFYDGESGTITVNPKSARSTEALLCHELLHAIAAELGGTPTGSRTYRKLVARAAEALGADECRRIAARYGEVGVVEPAAVFEEIAAHYGETIASPKLFRALFAERPSLGARVVSFFKGSASDYAAVSPLGGTARAFYKYFSRLARSLARINENSIAYFEPRLAGEVRAESAAAESRTLEWLSQQGSESAELVRAIEADEAITDESLEAQKTPATNTKNDSVHVTGDSGDNVLTQTKSDADTNTRFALVGKTEDGRGIYRTNYPKNTPKSQKQQDIIQLVQNVWSKKPIKLNLIVDGKEAPIEAWFNPKLTERSDLSKIAFGNRKGTASEKRITMNLSSDFYQIAEDSHYVGSKTELGKDNPAHFGVSKWHYFITNLVFVEEDGATVDCYLNIDVKQNDSGYWFYSFAIEKGSCPADVLSAVTDKTATTSTISITENTEKVNPSAEKNSTSNKKSGGRTPSANANALAGTPEANGRSSTNNSIIETTKKINLADEKISAPNKKSSASRTVVNTKKKAHTRSNSEVDTHTRFAIKYPDFSEADISNNMDAIADMEAVAAIDASKLEKTGKSPLDTFNEYFASLGNNIASETFGDIALPKSSAKSEIRHGITAEKIASIEAIPAVIEQGKVIFSRAKEGGVERIVVCAPIKIGDADYYMGVMLQRDARYQRLYLHNVVSVAIEREASSSSKDNLVTTGALANEDRLSITSILQNALAVKKKKVESQAPREKSPAMNEMKRKAERFANKDRAERAAFDMPASRSLSPIKLGMSANERYELLKGRSVAVTAVADVARLIAAVSNAGIDNSAFKQTSYGNRVKAFKNLGDELQVYKTYHNPDSGLAFSFSKGKMKECVSKQRFGYYDFAKLISCLDSVIDNAVEIEVHNLNEEGYKPDKSLIAAHVLVSAFSDGEYIVPVKLEIKELICSQNSLHVAISLNKIKKSELAKRGSLSFVENKKVNGIVKQGTTENGVAHCPPPSDSIIAQVDEKVNSKNKKNNKNDEKVYAVFGQSSSNRDFSRENGTSPSAAAEGIKKSELAKRGSPSFVENKKVNGIFKQGTTENGVAHCPPPFDSIIAQVDEKVNSKVEKNSKSYDEIFDEIVQNVAESDSWRQELSAFDGIGDTRSDSKSGGVALSELFAGLDEHDERLRKYVPATFLEKGKNGERYALTESFDEADNVPSSEKSEAPSRKRGLKGRAAAAYLATQIEFVNSQAGIEHAGRRLGVKNVEAFVQAARASKNQAQEMLAGRQWTIMSERVVKSGDGFYRIIAPVMKKGGDYYAKFQSYLFHSHNVDRMSLSARSVERNEANKARLRDIQARRQAIRAELSAAEGKELGARNAAADRVKALRAEESGLRRAARELKERIAAFAPEENKPVLAKRGKNGERVAVTAEESREAVRQYAELYPEFAEYAERVYAYLDNLQKLRLDAGLITEALYAELKEKYPHYVPTYRESVTPRAGAVRGAGNLAVNKTVSRATGGLGQLLSLEKSVSVMTESVIAAGNINRLIAKLYDAAESAQSSEFLVELSRRRLSSDDVAPEREKTVKKNQISFYRGGEEITLSVTPELYAGFRAFNAPSEFSSLPMRFLSASTGLFKKLVTSYNPFFLITNAVRDVMDAGINTKYSAAFPKNYVRAVYHLANNTEVAQLYRAVGGFNSSVFNYERGIVARQSKMGFAVPDGKLAPVFAKMENLNSFIEQLPRFAEFLSSVEAGNSAAQALLDAAEVTTNFGRSGKITRALNKTVIPFLNPAVQGLSKIIRNTREAFSSVRAFASFSLKLALLGILPQLVNQLFYEGDDDYEDLDDRTKENYFLFKVDDIFVRIPKGRVNSVVAGLVNRGARAAKGESVDWSDYVGNVISQITPVENFARPIWAPISDAINNVTWYGGKIESSRFEAVRPSERYDEATSSIAIRLGKLLNYSPKKLHYIIDQYSGIVGDLVLPLTTARAEKNPFLSRFTTDPVTSNRLSDDFYALYEEAQYSKAAGEGEAQYRLKYLSEVRAAASELYKQKRELQASELSDVDKLQQTRAAQALINELYKNAIVGYSEIESAIEKTQGMYEDESEARRRYAEIVRLSFGAEKALQAYSSSAYELASLLNRAGISFELLYSYYFAARDIKSGATESVGSKSVGKRERLVALVNSMPLTAEQKLLLIAMQGYSLKDGDVGGMSAERAKSRLASYIARRGTLSAAERAKLRKSCGISAA